MIAWSPKAPKAFDLGTIIIFFACSSNETHVEETRCFFFPGKATFFVRPSGTEGGLAAG